MNPVFWILVCLITIILWFVLRRLFHPLGNFLTKVFQDTKNIMNEETEDKKE